ncbi:FAD-dependent oxidoreductase [soil metagenome]
MRERVVIVGAGIVGLTLAYALNRRGWTVTVVESTTPGHGASDVNAGWICPSHVEPVPAPGLMRQSLKWMRHSDSPLYIQPRLSGDMAMWLLAFWRHCSTQAFRSGIEATAALSKQTFHLYDEMRASGVQFEEHRTGVIYVYESPGRLEKSYRAFSEVARNHSIETSELIWGDDLRNVEPALSDSVCGGYWIRQDRQVLPQSLNSGLVSYLTERGVDIRRNLPVVGFDVAGDRVTDVIFQRGRLETDAVVIAAGAWSPEVTKLARRRIPIQAGKGYALDYTPAPISVQHALHVDAGRHAITPFDGMTRLAGTMEFSGINERIRPERVNAIICSAARTLQGWPTDLSIPRIQSGLRPMSADGLPIIGWLPGYRNLAVATGHGMLGFTLAPATAEALTDLITTHIMPSILRPFDPGRFGWL